MRITACGGSAHQARLGTLSRRRSMLSTTSSPDSPTCPAERTASQTAPMFLGSFALRPGLDLDVRARPGLAAWLERLEERPAIAAERALVGASQMARVNRARSPTPSIGPLHTASADWSERSGALARVRLAGRY